MNMVISGLPGKLFSHCVGRFRKIGGGLSAQSFLVCGCAWFGLLFLSFGACVCVLMLGAIDISMLIWVVVRVISVTWACI